LWRERAIIGGGSKWLDSRAGFGSQPVGATLVAAGRTVDRDLVRACREAAVPAGVDAGITALPDALIARCLAPDTERATMWLVAVWAVLRPALVGRTAVPPRIWNT
jgi:urease accessory protein